MKNLDKVLKIRTFLGDMDQISIKIIGDMGTGLILDSNQFFKDIVREAFDRFQLKANSHIRFYLVDVLKHYLFIENLYGKTDSLGRKTRDNLGETLLKAVHLKPRERFEKLKDLADSSLYISGFFSDSFQRKIIDVDYYIDVGKLAYETLSKDVEEDVFSKLYKEISDQFVFLVDVLSFISQKAELTDKENILRTMEIYTKTQSPLKKEILVEKGVFPSKNNQDKDPFKQ